MVRIYKKKYFNLYSNTKEYIIHNTHKEFENGHTHIKNYNTAKFLINLALYKTVPNKKMSNYLYESLIRISSDKTYIEKIKRLKNKARH